jgi:hypothetical protein
MKYLVALDDSQTLSDGIESVKVVPPIEVILNQLIFMIWYFKLWRPGKKAIPLTRRSGLSLLVTLYFGTGIR